ncbi:hypothetical protein QYF61_007348 [Mycteria americana]|uniref:Uncharacterized protein n=1 Tax=Mycteria americana TaxID=33587 RepID=A0AAN7MSP0_MYCAM|nr:hypothetical protein QYF61_007348 [Mycteria americana]
MGVTFANLQSAETSPVSQDCWAASQRTLSTSLLNRPKSALRKSKTAVLLTPLLTSPSIKNYHFVITLPKTASNHHIAHKSFSIHKQQPSDHFCGPPLDLFQQVHVFLVLRTPEMDAVLQMGSHHSRAEWQNHLPRPAGHTSFDAAQDTVGFLGCECTLLAHVQLFIHQYPQVLLCRAALNPFIAQAVLIPGVALTQVQDLALGLVEPHEIHMGPLLELAQVPLDGIPVPQACQPHHSACRSHYVVDEDIKQYWSQYGPLRDTTHHRSPSRH